MPVNSATLVSRLTADKPRRKIGVVLRSCELRALIELVKLRQANVENLTIIGVDCPGTYSVEDYARLIDKMEGPGADKGARVVAELKRQAEGRAVLPSVPLRPACQMCEFPTPWGADITLGLIGVENGILVNLESDLATKLALVPGEAPDREKAIARLVDVRSAVRDQAFASFRNRVKSITDFADELATCIGCYTCSVVCPICYCKECFFRTDTFNPESERYFRWVERYGALRMPTEILLYHLTRLNHMVASCIGCGLCESACPAKLPLTTIFRAVGEGVQKRLDYVPGRSLEDKLPLLAIFAPSGK
jgi:formate dehydrogenase subunit beta